MEQKKSPMGKVQMNWETHSRIDEEDVGLADEWEVGEAEGLVAMGGPWSGEEGLGGGEWSEGGKRWREEWSEGVKWGGSWRERYAEGDGDRV